MKVKVIAILCTIMFCLNCTLFSFATSITDWENQKNEAENNKNEKEEELNDVQEEKSQTFKEIEQLSEDISIKQEEIDKLYDEVKELETSIKQVETELEAAEKNEKEQEEALKQRIVAQYKMGTISYWDILLKPSSLLDFVSNLHIFNKIADYDTRLMESLEKTTKEIADKKEELDNKKSKLKTAKANAEKENTKLKTAKAQKNSKIANLSEQEKELQKAIDEYQREMDEADAAISRLAASSGNGGNYSGGQLRVPCKYTRISSYFGNRESPGGGVGSRNHKGLDLAAPHGTTIIAAEAGTVIKVSNTCKHDYAKTVKTKCSCGGGYGNYMMISHGGGLVTLYAHCSSINVSVGQTVSAGQAIGAVGTTGYSTGNHLHFGVLLNGSYVNPLPYIS